MQLVYISHSQDTVSISAATTAYRSIKSRIVDGDLAGGTMVSEGELAATLGVSRTPVREAFLRLQAEGWMRLYPKRGALVLDVYATEKSDVLEARLLIESHAAAQVCRDPERAAELADQLTELLAEQREAAAELPGFAEVDARFHTAIVAAGGNRLIAGFAEGLAERQRRLVTGALREQPHRAAEVLEDHRDLVDAIRDRDAERFATALADHVARIHGGLSPG